MNKTFRWIAACAVAFSISAVAVFCLHTDDNNRRSVDRPDLDPDTQSGKLEQSGDEKARKSNRGREHRKSVRTKRISGKNKGESVSSESDAQAKERQADKPEIDVDDEDLSPSERKLKDAIEKALDDEDLAAARSLAAQAMIANNVEIRQAMVDTLGWFGAKALPELTPFLADPDEDVRDSAKNEWSMAISEIEDDAEKLGVVELAMHVLTDEDALDDISGEYIGTDEKLAVESLLRVIEAEGSEIGIAKAKETYEFVTGDEFTGRAAAERWIAEEYKPAEKD